MPFEAPFAGVTLCRAAAICALNATGCEPGATNRNSGCAASIQRSDHRYSDPLMLCQSTNGITMNAAKKCQRHNRPYNRVAPAFVPAAAETAPATVLMSSPQAHAAADIHRERRPSKRRIETGVVGDVARVEEIL